MRRTMPRPNGEPGSPASSTTAGTSSASSPSSSRRRSASSRPTAKLTPRPKELPAWDDQPADAKKVYLKLMENYAAYMAYTDHQVGRLIDSLAQAGELDNTLVMYIVGDNGAERRGGLGGNIQRSRQPGRVQPRAWPASSSESTRSAGRRASRTSRSAGPGPWPPRSSGPSRSPSTSAAHATR